MPSGVYPRTDAHRATISAAVKIAVNRPDVKAKHIKAMNRPDVKAKMSAAKRGKKYPKMSAAQKVAQNRPEVRAKNRATHTGKHFSSETKAKMSAAQTGENNHNWQGGISNFPYAFVFNEAFKRMIRNRDGNVCQLCGKIKEQEGRNLCVHHIDYDKNNECVKPDEFTTLCTSCNFKVNTRRDFWTEYFQLMLDIQTTLKIISPNSPI